MTDEVEIGLISADFARDEDENLPQDAATTAELRAEIAQAVSSAAMSAA